MTVPPIPDHGARRRILLSHRYFWPDTPPYAAILRCMGEALSGKGHEVHVFASRPSYRPNGTVSAPPREELDGMRVRRVAVLPENRDNPANRLFNALVYSCGLFVRVLRLRPDIVTVSSFPPVIAAWAAGLAARLTGARLIYHVQDIHPEVSEVTGGRLGRGAAAWLLRALDNGTLRRSTAVVVLSRDMAGTLKARGQGDLPIHVINNFVPEPGHDTIAAPPSALRKPPGRRRVVFAGNLGRFQDLETVTEGVVRALEARAGAEFLLLGDGVALPALHARWGDHPRVRFGPLLPASQARTLIADADAGIVSLRPGMHRVAYPSKLMTYLEAGVPVLAAVDPGSDLAGMIEREGLGTAPGDRSPEAIAAAVERLLDAPPSRTHIRNRHEATLSRERRLAQWSELVAEIPAR